MKNPNITVLLNTTATPELVSSMEPDAVIASVGARPAVPTYLPGYDRANVIPAEYAYTHVDEVGQKVVVIGGGLVGAELAIHLAICKKDVTLMHRHEAVKCGANGLHGQAIGEQLHIRKVGTAFNTSPVEINEKGVIGRDADGEKLYEADTVIYAVGQRPLADVAEQFRFCAPEFYTIGDCVTPATIYQATSQAFYAARDIGRI
jgi:pyruvate/2-oxoglutarate dehydrogenase complex dihydrolipoamide dehydrogenase (E3) component